jgi:hypothetical protein
VGHTHDDGPRTSLDAVKHVALWDPRVVSGMARALQLWSGAAFSPGSSRGTACRQSGGDEETRTPDPLLAKEMLYRLSYVPEQSPDRRSVRRSRGLDDGGRFWTRTRDLCLIRAVL